MAPAICGDFVVACYVDGDVRYVKHHFPECDVIAYIPKEELLTSKSRNVLPKILDYREAVEASGIANVLIAAILNGNLPLAGKMMEKDKWHEKYRKNLVPHLEKIRTIGHEEGAYGAYLSGAGPTVLVLTPSEKTEAVSQRLRKLGHGARIDILNIDRSFLLLLPQFNVSENSSSSIS